MLVERHLGHATFGNDAVDPDSVDAEPVKQVRRCLAPLVGGMTGLITAATGVFVLPAVPYLQAIGLEKEELVQALALSFTVSTIALTVNIVAEGGVSVSMAGTTIAALIVACAGMWVGQTFRLRMPATTFRRWFFVGLLLLGVYQVARSVA